MGVFRFLLAVSIIVFHCGSLWKFKFITGHVAVEAFFIISGFYMSLILNEKYIGRNKSYRLFLTNRCLRIFPIYWAVLIFTCLFSVITYKIMDGAHFPTLGLYRYTNASSLGFLCLTNLLMIGQDLVSFLGINPETGNLFFTDNFWITRPQLNMFLLIPQAWTLSIELLFYVLAPLLLRRKPILILIFVSLSAILRLYLHNVLGLYYDPWTFRFFPTEIVFFLLGYFAYRLYVRLSKFKVKDGMAWVSLSWLVASTMLFEYVKPFKIYMMPFSINEVFYFSSLLILVPLLFKYFKDNRIDRALGELSYPIYISHYLVVAVLNSLHIAILAESWCVILGTIAFSVLLNRFIGMPIERLRQRRLR